MASSSMAIVIVALAIVGSVQYQVGAFTTPTTKATVPSSDRALLGRTLCTTTTAPIITTTTLWGCGCGRRRTNRRIQRRLGSKNKRNKGQILSRGGTSFRDDATSFPEWLVDVVEYAESSWYERKLRRDRIRKKHMKFFYIVGFMATFPVGPILYLALRNRTFIKKRLLADGPDVAATVNNKDITNGSTIVDNGRQEIVQKSKQVDDALRTSIDVMKDIRASVEFKERLVQNLSKQTDELSRKAMDALSKQQQTENNDLLEARGYLSQRLAIVEQRDKLVQEISVEKTRWNKMEDSIWSLQNRAMELNEQLRD